jgi:5,10-methylenetetrahydrofolate reductase
VKITTLVEKFAVGADINVTQYLFEEKMLNF